MVIEAFQQVHDDPRIDEIVIVDDASNQDVYDWLFNKLHRYPKVFLSRNPENLGCYKNKARALKLAKNDWCIILDSDNIINQEYIDTIWEYEWVKNLILTPVYAAPHFSFHAYSGTLLTRQNISEYIDKPLLEVSLNAMNYFVNRMEYLRVFDATIEPMTSDSIFQAYNWLRHGNMIYITPRLRYEHRIHNGSHYKNNLSRTPEGFHNQILQSLRELK
jgi:glycosyltransferase involved in cell wall biosynthesis